MSVRWITADVFDGLAQLDDHSIDLVITSPPFLALRSYLPADHPDKGKEIGSEPTPAEFIDTLLAVTHELRRVLAPHGSICVELGDTYAGSGGAGGDYDLDGWREGQESFTGSSKRQGNHRNVKTEMAAQGIIGQTSGELAKVYPGAWPLAKSKTLIPQLYEIALAYGFNPLTGRPSPAGQWRIRNVVTWARPNPPVGALGDKWRPATSDLIVACTSPKRYWDDLATRRPLKDSPGNRYVRKVSRLDDERRPDGSQLESTDNRITADYDPRNSAGAPLLDYWEIPPGGYKGSHYAVFPEELVVPCVKAMCPEKVCRTCGEPSRRIVESERIRLHDGAVNPPRVAPTRTDAGGSTATGMRHGIGARYETTGWTDCGHDNWRPGNILDPFAGSGTTLAVASGHGHDAIGIDLDPRNEDLARERVGPLMFGVSAPVDVEVGE